jgi:hypothetical protein
MEVRREGSTDPETTRAFEARAWKCFDINRIPPIEFHLSFVLKCLDKQVPTPLTMHEFEVLA